MNHHTRFMHVALSLARRGLGQTWPNPSVGAVIVQNEQIIATSHTAKTGRPHAETQALEAAGNRAQNATLYVSLEPCSHHGKTPPCTEAIIASGIKTVVIACRDPNPKVNGAGIHMLKHAGITVIENICEKEALEINRGFFSVMNKNRPYIALKIATSLDGTITHPTQRWITGEPARNYGQLLRAQHDAIATGIGTILADNPQLTCRLAGLEARSPLRVIFDRNKRTPIDSAAHPALILQEPTIETALETLAAKGITRLLIEGGATLSSAFLQSNLVDRIYWFRAPIVIGENSLASFDTSLAPFHCISHTTLGNDSLEIFECSPAS